MRRLMQWAAWLYPAAWQSRYGEEFRALLEDVNPKGSDVWDVLKGALTMRMTMWNFGRITAACAVAGLIVAGLLAYIMPAEYVSTAVMRFAPPSPREGDSSWLLTPQMQLQQMQQQVLSRRSLAEIITRPALDLYHNDRTKNPLEDVIQEMRHRITIHPVTMGTTNAGAQAFAVSYSYPNKFKSQAVVRELVARFVEQNFTQAIQNAGTAPGLQTLEVLDPANLPDRPVSPSWPRMLLLGLAGGLTVGLRAAFVLAKPARHLLKIAAFGAAGFVVAAGLSFLVPNQYISTAVLRAGPGALPPEQLLDSDLLANLIAAQTARHGGRQVQSVEELRRRLTIRKVGFVVNAGSETAAFAIAFQSTGRFEAQWVVREVVSQAIRKQRQAVTQPAPADLPLLVLDPASDPGRPSSPNRLAMSSVGLLAGIVLGAWLLRHRRLDPQPEPTA